MRNDQEDTAELSLPAPEETVRPVRLHYEIKTQRRRDDGAH